MRIHVFSPRQSFRRGVLVVAALWSVLWLAAAAWPAARPAAETNAHLQKGKPGECPSLGGDRVCSISSVSSAASYPAALFVDGEGRRWLEVKKSDLPAAESQWFTSGTWTLGQSVEIESGLAASALNRPDGYSIAAGQYAVEITTTSYRINF